MRQGLDLLNERDGLPVVLLGDREACAEALEAGADDFLADPFDPHELCCRVAARLERAGRAPGRRARARAPAEAHMAAEAMERSRRAEEALRDAKEEAEAANQAKDQLPRRPSATSCARR